MCLPVGALLFVVFTDPGLTSAEYDDVPTLAMLFVIFLGTIIHALWLSLGVYIARRKARKNDYTV